MPQPIHPPKSFSEIPGFGNPGVSKLTVARREGSREGQAGRGDPEPAPHLSLTWARPAPAGSRGTQGATSARHAREAPPGGRDPGPWQRPAPATDPIRSPPAAACRANPAQLPALRPASLEAPGPERGETPTHAPRPPRSDARSHRGLPRGTPGAPRAPWEAREGRAGPARRGAGRPPQAVPPATYQRRWWRRWRWRRRPRSGSRARWLGIMGMARPSSGGGARPGRTPARESAPTCTASACARTRTAQRAGGAHGPARKRPRRRRGSEPAWGPSCPPTRAWRSARRRERAQPRGAGGRARWQFGHGEGRGRGQQKEGRRTVAPP